jgi:type IV pilus assembly protein PilA
MSATATDTNGKYVTQVDVVNGVIEVTYGHEANNTIDTLTLEMVPYTTPDGSVVWRCGGAPLPGGSVSLMSGAAYNGGSLAGTNFVRYLPAACRP